MYQKNGNKILLVNPPEANQGGRSNPPLGLLYLASMVRENTDWTVGYFDGFLSDWQGYEGILRTFQPDIVGVTMLTKDRFKSLKALRLAKENNCVTITGGAHASAMAEQILETYTYVDHVFKGEAERSLAYFLKYYKDKWGKIIDPDPETFLDNIPFPAWDMANLETDRYLGDSDIRIPIVSSRGCAGKCAFCSTWRFWKSYRVRPAKNVVEEITYIVKAFGKHHFVFEDDSLSCDLATTKEVMQAIINADLDIRFFSTMRADGMDLELAQMIKRAGGYGVSIGFESGSQRILDIMKKDITVEQNMKAGMAVKEAGLQLCALIIRGNVGENDQTRKETHDFLNELRPDDLGSLGELWILPDTRFWSLVKKHTAYNDDFWLKDDLDHEVFRYRGELDFLYK